MNKLHYLLYYLAYKRSVVFYKIRFGLIESLFEKMKRLRLLLKIMVELKNRGISKKKSEDIISRFFRMKFYLERKESVEAMGELRDFMVKWCEQMDIKQWDGKEMLKRDFDIDL
jgi:hypothetical protein